MHLGVVGSLDEAVTVTVTTDQSCAYFHGAEKQTASQISEIAEKRKQTTNSSKLRRWLLSRDFAPDVEMSCDITTCSWGRYLKFHISSHLEANEIQYDTSFCNTGKMTGGDSGPSATLSPTTVPFCSRIVGVNCTESDCQHIERRVYDLISTLLDTYLSFPYQPPS